ncbi:MAG: tetratricopeptide repeat protein [Bacteroidia bacterium]|nr:tetratricopeptide repeat protein [Bacteroidia bacterium]
MRYLLTIVITLLVGTTVAAQKERKYIRDSYNQYTDGKFEEAQESSVRAMAEAPDSYEANYNYACSLFKQEKVDEALEKFSQMASSEKDKDKLSQLYHNIGNCHYVKQEFDKSVESYKKSLRANPNGEMGYRTRYNLVAAQKMLQDNPQQDNQQNQDNQEQQHQQDQQQEQQQQDQNKDQQQQQQEQQKQEQEMSKEDAQRLLDALQQDENKLHEERDKINGVANRNIEKNW